MRAVQRLELQAHPRRAERDDVAIGRLELLYPFPGPALTELIESYPNLSEVVWAQEEPRNMGFWHYMKLKSQRRSLGEPLLGITRPVSASPATGSLSTHRREQEELLDAAFAD